MNNNQEESEKMIAQLYPDLTPEQRQEAFENLDRYLELSWRMYVRIRKDSDAYAEFRIWLERRTAQRQGREPQK